MGTRADFYVGRGEQAEWLGSIAWDGYPEGIDDAVLNASTLEDFRSTVTAYIEGREDGTKPSDGWPWPWETSHTTDYAYAFDEGKVHASCFGGKWFDPHKSSEEDEDEGKVTVFPNMKDRTNVTFGKRSGLLIIGGAQ